MDVCSEYTNIIMFSSKILSHVSMNSGSIPGRRYCTYLCGEEKRGCMHFAVCWTHMPIKYVPKCLLGARNTFLIGSKGQPGEERSNIAEDEICGENKWSYTSNGNSIVARLHNAIRTVSRHFHIISKTFDTNCA